MPAVIWVFFFFELKVRCQATQLFNTHVITTNDLSHLDFEFMTFNIRNYVSLLLDQDGKSFINTIVTFFS